MLNNGFYTSLALRNIVPLEKVVEFKDSHANTFKNVFVDWFKAAVVRPDGFGGHWEHNVTNYVDLTSPFATEGIDEVKYAGPGDYYLLIEAEVPFTIIIEEKR